MTLKENDAPRLKQLISVCVRQKHGISYIVEKLNKSIAGIYNPKGYAEFNKDLAAFALIAGEPSLLHVLHQASGLPTLSTAYRTMNEANVLKGVNVTVNYCSAITDAVDTNIQVLIINDSSCSSPVKLWSLKVDELSVDGRLRYRFKTNELIGMCCQHRWLEQQSSPLSIKVLCVCPQRFRENWLSLSPLSYIPDLLT